MGPLSRVIVPMVYSCCIRSGYIGVMLDQKSVLACGKCQASTWRVEIGGFYLARARNRIQKLKGNCLARIIFCVPHMYLNLGSTIVHHLMARIRPAVLLLLGCETQQGGWWDSDSMTVL